jgi:hypothetical protein
MPIVFVHGVNNREGQAYREGVKGRDGFLRTIVAPALGLSSSSLYIDNPYWGDDGAKFYWGMAVLPEGKTPSFGPVNFTSFPPIPGGLVNLAKQKPYGLAWVVDLLYGAALLGAKTDKQADGLASAYLAAMKWATTSSPEDVAWLENLKCDAAGRDSLVSRINARASKLPQANAFGAAGFFNELKEGLSRLVDAVPDVATGALNFFARKSLNATITRFVGDVFTYLNLRGTPEAPGPIVQTVLDSLTKANSAKRAQGDGDDKLIVIGHSFGGAIMYDILTSFRPELEVDLLITVGSQVGLFEEMKVYLASKENIPPNYPSGRVPKPDGAKRWLNVFDKNDILSYRAEPIFAAVEDFEYDTGYESLEAHGGYFLRPSFYARLAERLKASNPK